MKVFVISGRSGSGKSTVLHALEDAGYTCIDNFPVLLLNQLIDKYVDNQNYNNLAVSIDARSPSSELNRLPEVLPRLSRARSFSSRIFGSMDFFQSPTSSAAICNAAFRDWQSCTKHTVAGEKIVSNSITNE